MKIKLPVRKAVLDKTTYQAPEEGRWGKIRLDFNENTAGCSPAVLRAVAKLSAKQLAMYPEYEATTQKLSKYFGARAEELLLANGGDDVLRLFFDAFVDAGSRVLLCEPTFPMYRYYTENSGAHVDAAMYGPEMEFPMTQVLALLRKKPRLLILANPNNPTGTLLSKKEIERLLHAATHTVVVMDEAYAEFSGVTVIPWVRKYPQLFVVRTFSKAAGLAGLRLGAAIAQKASLDILRRVALPYPVNSAALVAAEAAVGDAATLKRFVREAHRVRAWFVAELQRLGVKTYPSAANFILVNLGECAEELVRYLERRGILLRARGNGLVRISIGTEAEMKRVIREIRKFLGKK